VDVVVGPGDVGNAADEEVDVAFEIEWQILARQ
jgi:hypothetical protein